MRSKYFLALVVLLVLASSFFGLCIRDYSVESPKPSIEGKPVEDTTRVYLNPNTGDTLEIYPPAVFAKFYPWVTDTNQIKPIFEKYKLRQSHPFFGMSNAWAVYLCVTDNRRAEYHFTPWGKEGFTNFGTDSLVEYAFAFFEGGYRLPTGEVYFVFEENTPESRIDSLFDEYGLRLLYNNFGFYRTIITPRAPKNPLDLGWDLKTVPFATYVSVEIGQPIDPGKGPLVTCE